MHGFAGRPDNTYRSCSTATNCGGSSFTTVATPAAVESTVPSESRSTRNKPLASFSAKEYVASAGGFGIVQRNCRAVPLVETSNTAMSDDGGPFVKVQMNTAFECMSVFTQVPFVPP